MGVATGTASSSSAPAGSDSVPQRRGGALWRLVVETVATCFRYRVTGLAAEAGFWALLSLPPLVLGLAASLGYLGDVIGEDTIAAVQASILDFTGTFLTQQSVVAVIEPTLEEVFTGPRVDLISIGFLISLWSGSRALNVYVDTITIMYGLAGHRGIARTRALSFSLYLVGLVLGAIVVPLVLAGPRLIDAVLPPTLEQLSALYWPLVTLLSVAFLTSLYHVSVPVRTPWWRDLPGAVLALAIWLAGGAVIRWVISVSVGGPSIYGPLAAPIIVLIWLYVLAIAVLIGAALNSALDTEWPARETAQARHEGPNQPSNRRPTTTPR
jgi:membrane protein